MTQERRRFYEERDLRTIAYLGGGESPHRVTVSVHAGQDACDTQAGHLLLLALANQMARTHRGLRFSLAEPDRPLLIRSLCHGQTLGNEIEELCRRIDPFGSFVVDGPLLPPSDVSIGVGIDAPPNLAWYLGCDRSLAHLARSQCPLGNGDTADLRGAGLAAILGAATAFKAGVGLPTVPVILSAWNLKSGNEAAPGPSTIPMIDVGRGLMIGVGAVGTAVMYWLGLWGTKSTWTVVDGDTVALDNTNRCLLFFPKDAGWPDQASLHKVTCVATRVPNVNPLAQWYDEAPPPRYAYDTVVVLANERDVRTRVSVRNDPIQFQATTGRSWMSQLHRHIAGRDDCVRCRMNDIKDPRLACAAAPVDKTEDSAEPDAALPFLSAASGLMLVSALQRLQSGDFGGCRINTWRWDFRSTHEMVSVGEHCCQSACSTTLPTAIRGEIAKDTRWVDSPWRTT